MNLSAVFTHVARKKLVAVDLPGLLSRQHEINGKAALRSFFGTSGPTQGSLQWHYFADEREPEHENGTFTFYDSRKKGAARTGRSAEWRFYYTGDFLKRASVGDSLFLARSKSEKLFALVFQQDSAWLRAAQELFGAEASTPSLAEIDQAKLQARDLELLRRQILQELGLDVTLPVRRSDEELMVRNFGEAFPTTKEMSAFARAQVEVNLKQSDETLVCWLDREEELFRALENVIIRRRLQTGFESVDTFVEYSLSVQNRRKSRMGFALQNHLAALFDYHRIRYAAQTRTEGKRKPDFIFPGHVEYHDASFRSALLVMLGAKATCKDRWRQVLTEAQRIPNKHLCTLEPGISTAQTEEMRQEHVTLVVPTGLHATYTREQLPGILSIDGFLTLVRKNQG
ncbi:MAG TPA: type II restriction endonuclease [Verrucomicrobiae bacterium]|nr:type II restriction endonuclease [Verrucomicrobiae bacterium]